MMQQPARRIQDVAEMYKKLQEYISELEDGFNGIPALRKKELRKVAYFINRKVQKNGPIKLLFICTHNSRRSHFAQIWASTAVYYYGVEGVKTYSGGTEVTAFNPRAVAAIKRAGFEVCIPDGANPKYEVCFSKDQDPIICFSKKYDDASNPKKHFIAVMTCSDADKNCPIVPGSDLRKTISYKDPKEADNTVRETQIYDERCRQIATEMFYMMRSVNNE